ncbi:MAG: hypothetical protein JNM00_07030 [Flavobacteriales bacterium]|nr:hypothetical protein [Flavobacteriales bacterium]
MVYPKDHRHITDDLMSGKFILASQESFTSLKENAEFYTDFFKQSFNYELVIKSDYAYLLSKETNENFSRDVCIFIAVLSYELDRDGKNFMDALEFSEFTIEEVDRYFENTSFIDLIESNKQLRDAEGRRHLINAMTRRNIAHKNFEDRFTFTPAYKMFIDFAKELALKRMGGDLQPVMN